MISEIFKDILKEGISISEPPKHIDADVSITVFERAKLLKKPPTEIIKELAKELENNQYIKEITLEGPYLNINLNWNRILKNLKNKVTENRLFEFEKKSKKILIEHTSVNPNKSLHIGHIRNAFLGDTLHRILKVLGYKVEVLNYIDDTGLQVSDTVLGFYFLKFPENPKEFNLEKWIKNLRGFLKEIGIKEEILDEKIEEVRKFVQERIKGLKNMYGDFPERFDSYAGEFVYVIVNKLYEIFPELELIRKKVSKAIEEGNNETSEFAKEFVDKILKLQLKTLWRFDIYYDLLNFESDIVRLGLWEETFKLLKNKGIIKYVEEGEKAGTWCIDLTKYGIEESKDKLKVLVRSDGTTVYVAKDIAYAFWKHGILNKDFKYKLYLVQPNGKELWRTSKDGMDKEFGKADISINIIGSEQKYLQTIVSKVVEDFSEGEKKYIYYPNGLVMLSGNTARKIGIETEKEIVKMSGRRGIGINVDVLLDKMKEIVKENGKMRGQEYDNKTAERIARSSLRYELIKYNPASLIVFDIDKALDIERNTSLYIQYTYARARSVLEKYEKDPIEVDIKIVELTKEERDLMKKMIFYKKKLEDFEKDLKITSLIEYIHDLSSTFNEFYQKVPILKEIDKYPHRILLVHIFTKILEKYMEMLGIDLVEKI